MSEHAVTVVRLDEPAAEDHRLAADRARALLLGRRLIRADERRDPRWQPGAWQPGQSVAGAFLTTADNGVDIESGRRIYDAAGTRRSRTAHAAGRRPRYSEAFGDWAEAWLTDGLEPRFACGVCGFDGLVGAWSGGFSLLVGAPAVTFHNWPPLSATLLADLRTTLGGRAGIVHTHL